MAPFPPLPCVCRVACPVQTLPAAIGIAVVKDGSAHTLNMPFLRAEITHNVFEAARLGCMVSPTEITLSGLGVLR